MANKYGVVRTDLLTGTDSASRLRSVRYLGADGATPTAIENGSFAKLTNLMDGERELWIGKVPAASDALADIVLIATPEVMYDERKKNLDEFINEAGRDSRGYVLHQGDMFSISAEGLDIATGATPAVGWVVVLQANAKAKLAASATGTKIGTVVAIETTSRYTYYVIKVA